jgi:polygalacturonase
MRFPTTLCLSSPRLALLSARSHRADATAADAHSAGPRVTLARAAVLAGLLGMAMYAAPGPAAAAATANTGDTRTVTQPTLPSTCETLTATLSTSDEKFSSSQEASPPDTSRIQAALNSCSGTGKAVVLAGSGSDDAFLSGPLTMSKEVYLVVDGGVTLYASLVASEYQVSGNSDTCGEIESSDNGCNAFITVDGEDSGIEGTANSSGTRGEIDGRGDQDVYGTSTTWFDLANTATSESKKQNNPRLVEVKDSNSFTVYDLDLVNSPKEHLYYEGGDGFTVWGLEIKTPATAHNTDGIDIDSSQNATVNDSYIQDGDDGVAIQTNSAEAKDITVENSHFYGTHGISIGSETSYGVDSILVENNTIQGTDSSGNESSSNNGLRIKSDSSVGGEVQSVVYDDNCLTGVEDLLDFNPFYASGDGDDVPNFKSVTVDGLKSVSSASGAESVLEGYSSSDPLGLTLENVSLDVTKTSAEYANIGLYDSNITASGTGVTTSTVSGSGSVPSCSFPSYPAL